MHPRKNEVFVEQMCAYDVARFLALARGGDGEEGRVGV